MPQTSEVAFIAAVFFITYWLADTRKKNQQQTMPREKSVALERILCDLRVHGVDINRCYELAGELIRRGVPASSIPTMNAGDTKSLYDLQAKLELMITEVPYAPRMVGEPGEDSTLAKSTWQLWPRPLEEQNGDA
jgi:hypothetical protein